MRRARAYGLVGLAVVVAVAAVAFAQTTVVPLPDNAPVQTAPIDASAVADPGSSPGQVLAKAQWGDAKRGAGKAATCAGCHGLDGNPTDPQYPRLAGQSERYVARQLALFKGGERTSGMAAIMLPYAAPLSAQDMRDLGAYFATQKSGAGVADDSVVAAGPNAGLKFYAAGEKLFRGGDAVRGIPACLACHGPAGAGNPGPAYPRIAGQPSAYVARRLQEYRAGTTSVREPALFEVMATITKSLTDEEIQSLASYLQGLHERSDEASPEAVAAAIKAAPPQAAPVAPAAPAAADAAPAQARDQAPAAAR